MSVSPVPLNGTHSEINYLGRLLDIMELVTVGPTFVSFRQAARLLGVPPSTAHRLLTLLIDRGYCDRAEDGMFRPGVRLLSMGIQALDQLPHWAAANSVVSALGEATGESASFGVVIGDQIVLIARHNSPQPLTSVASVGDVMPPHTSALGKAVLANASVDTRARLVRKFSPDNSQAILASLEAELNHTAKRGYSVDEETFTPGLRCRAVPVYDDKSALLGALSISGPSVRLTPERAATYVPLLEDAAKRLCMRPGPLGPNPRCDTTQQERPSNTRQHLRDDRIGGENV